MDRKLGKVSEEARKKTNKEANRRKEEREAAKRKKLQAIKVLDVLGNKISYLQEGLFDPLVSIKTLLVSFDYNAQKSCIYCSNI